MSSPADRVYPLRMKIAPRSKADEPRLVAALAELCASDPEVAYEVDPSQRPALSFGHYAHVPHNVSTDPGTFPPAIGKRA